jgi:CelD/BcsL family acetyltransferase involved in cellulose biosynthesis
MEYDIEFGGKVYALRADYDEAYASHSPGAFLEYHIIKHLFTNSYVEYNTGPGLNDYKLHWTDEFKENKHVLVCNRSLTGWLIWTLEGRLVPLLKRALRKDSEVQRKGVVARAS